MTADLCLLDLGPERRPADVGRICRSHDYRLRLDLNSLRDNWAAALVGESDRGGSAPTLGRSATRVYSPVPVDVGSIDRAAELAADAGRLAYWARAVASARGVLPAAFPRSTVGQVDFLRLHLPWITARPAVVEFNTDLQRICERVRGLAGTQGKGERVGLCKQRTAAGRCDGELLRDRAGIVRCHRDPSHVDHVQAKPREKETTP